LVWHYWFNFWFSFFDSIVQIVLLIDWISVRYYCSSAGEYGSQRETCRAHSETGQQRSGHQHQRGSREQDAHFDQQDFQRHGGRPDRSVVRGRRYFVGKIVFFVIFWCFMNIYSFMDKFFVSYYWLLWN